MKKIKIFFLFNCFHCLKKIYLSTEMLLILKMVIPKSMLRLNYIYTTREIVLTCSSQFQSLLSRSFRFVRFWVDLILHPNWIHYVFFYYVEFRYTSSLFRSHPWLNLSVPTPVFHLVVELISYLLSLFLVLSDCVLVPPYVALVVPCFFVFRVPIFRIFPCFHRYFYFDHDLMAEIWWYER